MKGKEWLVVVLLVVTIVVIVGGVSLALYKEGYRHGYDDGVEWGFMQGENNTNQTIEEYFQDNGLKLP